MSAISVKASIDASGEDEGEVDGVANAQMGIWQNSGKGRMKTSVVYIPMVVVISFECESRLLIVPHKTEKSRTMTMNLLLQLTSRRHGERERQWVVDVKANIYSVVGW